MPSAQRILGLGALVLAAALLAGISATIGWRPIVGPRARALTDIRFEPTPARLERGRYLVQSGGVGCIVCHSEVKADSEGRLSIVSGMALAGRSWTSDDMPFLTAPNLTPDPETGIGAWSDDELARAIREGISRDGRALFPIMPYEKMRALTDDDLASVIVYLRAQAPVSHPLPNTNVPFPVSRLINAVPEPVTAPVTADLSTPEKRGRYLTTIAACADCHTPMDERGARLPGMDFAGGMPFTPGGVGLVRSANITPDAGTGIGTWTEEQFLDKFRAFRGAPPRQLSPAERQQNTEMPWAFYAGMTDDDLRAIYAYLRTVPPVVNRVEKFPPAASAR